MSDESTQLLRRLLSAWRSTRDPALEPLIDKAGAAVGRARGPITRVTADESAWHELAKARDPGDIDRLLDAPWSIGDRAARARVLVLGGYLADPRIALRLANLGRTRITEESHDMHRAIANVLERMPSARLIPALDAIEAARPHDLTSIIYRDARHAIAQLAPTAAESSLLERARRELGSDDDLEALLAQHTANPGDLALRAVIADRLQAAGDPRGELIALQLDGSKAALRRADRLLEQYGDTWTGPLPGVDREHRRYERGFLVAAFVRLSPSHLPGAIDRPEWVTIEELAVAGPTANVAALVKRMPLLRRFAGPRWVAEQLAAAGVAKTVQTMVITDGYLPPTATTFPALDVLLWRETWSTPAKRLRLAKELGLRAVGEIGADPEAIARTLKAGRGLGLELRFSWGGADRGLWIPGWQLRIAADRSHASVQYGGGRHALHDAGSFLQILADAGIPRIAVHAPSPAARAAANAITGAKIELRADRFDFLG